MFSHKNVDCFLDADVKDVKVRERSHVQLVDLADLLNVGHVREVDPF